MFAVLLAATLQMYSISIALRPGRAAPLRMKPFIERQIMKSLKGVKSRNPVNGWNPFLLLLILMFGLISGLSHAWAANFCIDCHKNPDWLVTNKKLYSYFQEWESSIHRQESVSCADCHGGNPDSADKIQSHGQDLMSGVNFRNIPKTCGGCHKDIEEGFRLSEHFEHIVVQNQELQGPTCVSCHGSINAAALNVNTVRAVCTHCHNLTTENDPSIPGTAQKLLNQFLSIHRYYRYIVKRGEAAQVSSFFKTIDPQIEKLSMVWHTFDLEEITEKTRNILDTLKEKRKELRKIK